MMSIPADKTYPRTGDKQTVYLDAVIKDPGILMSAYTMYNDFVNDPQDFEKNNVLDRYPINGYGSVILTGVHIGDGAIIGARAAVTGDAEPYTIVGSVPADVTPHSDFAPNGSVAPTENGRSTGTKLMRYAPKLQVG